LGLFDTLYKDLKITLRQAVETEGVPVICEGESINLGAVDLDGAKYEWKGPNDYFSEAQFPTIINADPSQSGSYEVIGIISGCATFPAYSNVEVVPTPSPQLGIDTVFCILGNPLILDPGTFSKYAWHDGSSQSVFTVIKEGVHSVTVEDEIGCLGVDEVLLIQQCPTEIYIPNAFSPNGDGINDEFQVLGHDIISMKMMVYDRWGNLVFKGNHQDSYWNGKLNNKEASSGTYIWILHLEGYRSDGSVYQELQKGSINLIR